MTESTAAFREALSRFASGVVVATAFAADGPVGFTASAFSSVSLDPPLVLFCVAKKASAYAGIVGASAVGISVLGAGQRWIAEQFARHGGDRFAGVPLRPGAPVPLVEGAIAELSCRRHAVHDAGDHAIVVVEVLESRAGYGRPLVHYARAFGAFTPEGAHGEAAGDVREPSADVRGWP
jgi:flavin reductase (DIM6/NTAB) family NADH-FMN oxidoreductase RutF